MKSKAALASAARKFRAKNTERINSRRRENYIKNRDKLLAQALFLRKKHPDRYLEYCRAKRRKKSEFDGKRTYTVKWVSKVYEREIGCVDNRYGIQDPFARIINFGKAPYTEAPVMW